jgi:hypothetical protein
VETSAEAAILHNIVAHSMVWPATLQSKRKRVQWKPEENKTILKMKKEGCSCSTLRNSKSSHGGVMPQSPSDFHRLANTENGLCYTRQPRVGNMEFTLSSVRKKLDRCCSATGGSWESTHLWMGAISFNSILLGNCKSDRFWETR